MQRSAPRPVGCDRRLQGLCRGDAGGLRLRGRVRQVEATTRSLHGMSEQW